MAITEKTKLITVGSLMLTAILIAIFSHFWLAIHVSVTAELVGMSIAGLFLLGAGIVILLPTKSADEIASPSPPAKQISAVKPEAESTQRPIPAPKK